MTADRGPAELYVFAVVAASHPCDVAGLSGIGGPGTAVWRVAGRSTAAVVCAPPAAVGAKRQSLLIHRQVLDVLWRQDTVLPMRFGTVAPSEERLRDELIAAEDRHIRKLAEVAGCGEMTVKLTADEDVRVRQITQTDPTVRRLMGAGGGDLARVRLGEAVAAALHERSSADARLVERTLTPVAVRMAPAPLFKECPINASFLVLLNRLDEFRSRAAAAQARLGAGGSLSVTGPLPPYSFAE